MQVVGIDFVGPLLETEEGNRYILVVGGHFTKYMMAYPLSNQEAITVGRILVEEYFCQYRVPQQLHSDQGSQYESELIQEVCKILDIKKTRTTPHHPSCTCNGEIERFNRTLADILATTLDNRHLDWDRHVKKACLAYNTSVHSTTGYTPFFLMHGYEAGLPVDLLCDSLSPQSVSQSEYASEIQQRLHSVFQRVRNKTNQQQLWQKSYYDRKVHGERFHEGQLMWLWHPAIPHKQGYC